MPLGLAVFFSLVSINAPLHIPEEEVIQDCLGYGEPHPTYRACDSKDSYWILKIYDTLERVGTYDRKCIEINEWGCVRGEYVWIRP